jgi:hypothetical protein
MHETLLKKPTDPWQAQRMEVLEKNQGWKEPDFDTVLQYLRTVLLRRMFVHTSDMWNRD